ncbi:MAG TPA: ROK family transcriptional regulator [Mesotoga sp.]|nr:ROK family transcriptional regulator [Mesotoga sp.]MDD4477664.1 ROK family transcriptional regulator [Mesotoga sp.]MDD5744232.1 ROK family transcriptional regulator [Mesotoga sp.]HOY26575.1 ROK family transcriptional regulator [Mesotoga sp.]HPI17232.1 ROK family transcriptional regulator [Mesotoga sp.]
MSRCLRETEEKVMRIVRCEGLISRADIARKSGLSKPVVSVVVNNFISQGSIVEAKEGESSRKGGKKPILLSFVPDYKYIVGVDVGGNKLISILSDLDGKIIEKAKFSTKSISDEKAFFELVEKSVLAVMKVPVSKVMGIGIGVPGTVAPESGMIFYMPAFGLRKVNLKSHIEERFEVPTFVSNDVTLNALGEMWAGAAKGCRNVFLTALGTGTGAGLIINNELYEGTSGMAGEIGYMITDWSREKNLSFVFGSLESWFSGYAFEKLLSEFENEPTVAQMFDYSDINPRFKEIVTVACEHLSVVVANVITLLDPDVVVITGGIGYNQYDRILSLIMPVLKRTVPGEILERVTFKRGELGELGVSLGAVCNVQRKVFMEV